MSFVELWQRVQRKEMRSDKTVDEGRNQVMNILVLCVLMLQNLRP